jgi:hypothetical protein
MFLSIPEFVDSRPQNSYQILELREYLLENPSPICSFECGNTSFCATIWWDSFYRNWYEKKFDFVCSECRGSGIFLILQEFSHSNTEQVIERVRANIVVFE